MPLAGAGNGAAVACKQSCVVSRSTVRGLGWVIALAPVLLGGGLVALALTGSFALALVLMPLLGLGQMLLMASCNSVIQTIVDDDKRGRVMSLYTMAFMGMTPFGSLLAGFVAHRIGTPQTLIIGSVCCIIGALWFARKLPVIREKVRPIYVRLGILPEIASGLQAAANATTPPTR